MADLEFFLKNKLCRKLQILVPFLKNYYPHLEYISDLKLLNSQSLLKTMASKTYSNTQVHLEAHRDAIVGVDSKTEIREKKYFGKFDRKLTFTPYQL